MKARRVNVRVNGQQFERSVEPRLLLADFLREELHLTGTHVGCEHGVCGACTVLLNGDSVRSCLTFAVQCDGADISTVEGLGHDGDLSVIQRVFHEHHALQCGFCTPGILMTVVDLSKKRVAPTEADVRDALSGNLCRCTGYQSIVAAVLTLLESEQGRQTELEASKEVGNG
jgi:carbon-monoxide dehydrogenase small subunit